MLSREMFAFVTERLIQCNIDLDNIGIVLIGDPAQILPIAAEPLWSARSYTHENKKCSSLSINGLIRFRQVFKFPPLQTIPTMTNGNRQHRLKIVFYQMILLLVGKI
ncbi:hypothetical protein DPMN_104742 [Dreissena polymorpha]|uniref:Uncharacterized protein n=1 Tax=Dreissena polymorpha TaxID=45954 RepID=A0A9D4HAJ2_DREPO|nr:hypothetical protein DPMN_104742 [Dreissena polymorpha]